MRVLCIISLSLLLQSCDSLSLIFYKPDSCDHGRQYKGRLKKSDFDPHKSKRPDM